MNEFFSVIKNIADGVYHQAEKSMRVGHLKVNCIHLRKMLGEQYRVLGAAAYEASSSGKDVSPEKYEEIAGLALQIRRTRRRIKALEKRLNEMQGLVRCPNCGSLVKMKRARCNVCGKKLAAEEEAVYFNENEMNIPRCEEKGGK